MIRRTSIASPKTGDSKAGQPATPVAPPNIPYMKESPVQPPAPTLGPSPSPGIQSDSVRTIHEGMPLPMPYEVITSGGRTTVDSEASLPSPSISVMRSYKNARCRQIALQSDLADALVRQGVEEQAILGRWLPPGLVQALTELDRDVRRLQHKLEGTVQLSSLQAIAQVQALTPAGRCLQVNPIALHHLPLQFAADKSPGSHDKIDPAEL